MPGSEKSMVRVNAREVINSMCGGQEGGQGMEEVSGRLEERVGI